MRRKPVPALKKTIAKLKEGIDKKEEAVCEDAFKALTESECLRVRTHNRSITSRLPLNAPLRSFAGKKFVKGEIEAFIDEEIVQPVKDAVKDAVVTPVKDAVLGGMADAFKGMVL